MKERSDCLEAARRLDRDTKGLMLWHGDRVMVLKGDCLDALAGFDSESVDALVTDPPSGISFMGKAWDGDKGGRDQWIAWLTERMRVAYRLLKPGAHALVWAIPRTSHWTATAVEDAGFEIRDVVMHLFGSGFPKSLDVSKAIDEALGAEREVIGPNPHARPIDGAGSGYTGPTSHAPNLTAPATEQAQQWAGWGTALKPACEHWILARKPLAGTVARNVMQHGTGGLNVDGCRIGTDDNRARPPRSPNAIYGNGAGTSLTASESNPIGRWPAHVVLSHADGCELVGQEHEERELIIPGPPRSHGATYDLGHRASGEVAGTETVTRDVYRCVEECPVRMLDEQSGDRGCSGGAGVTRSALGFMNDDGWSPGERALTGRVDSGGASRFFYVAKPARSEKETGLAHLEARTAGEATDREDGSAGLQNPRAGAGRTGGARNIHPTVKSVDLMRWLCRLVTPPGGVVLDMFAGSGTTLVAALEEDFRVVGVELDADGEYMPILLGRVREALGRHKQLDLFGAAL